MVTSKIKIVINNNSKFRMTRFSDDNKRGSRNSRGGERDKEIMKTIMIDQINSILIYLTYLA